MIRSVSCYPICRDPKGKMSWKGWNLQQSNLVLSLEKRSSTKNIFSYFSVQFLILIYNVSKQISQIIITLNYNDFIYVSVIIAEGGTL